MAAAAGAADETKSSQHALSEPAVRARGWRSHSARLRRASIPEYCVSLYIQNKINFYARALTAPAPNAIGVRGDNLFGAYCTSNDTTIIIN